MSSDDVIEPICSGNVPFRSGLVRQQFFAFFRFVISSAFFEDSMSDISANYLSRLKNPGA